MFSVFAIAGSIVKTLPQSLVKSTEPPSPAASLEGIDVPFKVVLRIPVNPVAVTGVDVQAVAVSVPSVGPGTSRPLEVMSELAVDKSIARERVL